MSNICIVGLGNLLLKDDGIGPRVVQELWKDGLPPGVDAVEAAGSFEQHWEVISLNEYIIVVDSILGGSPPGTIYLLQPGDIEQDKVGPFQHEEHFLSSLRFMSSFGYNPMVTIVGVEPKEICYSLELSPEIHEKLPVIIKIVREQYSRLISGGLSFFEQPSHSATTGVGDTGNPCFARCIAPSFTLKESL